MIKIKKLFAMVLTVCLLLTAVPVGVFDINISAATPLGTIGLGKVAIENIDGVECLVIPVELTENNGELYTGRYQVWSNDGLEAKTFKNGTIVYNTIDEFDEPVSISLDYISHVNNDYIQVLFDSNGGEAGLLNTTGNVGYVCFVAPTTPGIYTFSLVWLDGTDNQPEYYAMATNPATTFYDNNDYTVTFKNYDGTVLSTETYRYGDEVVAPATPSRPADNTYTYTFAGWDKEVVDCNGNAEYTATYSSNYINYTVVFKNYDGTVLSTKNYHYGDAIVAPADPTRPADNTYTYTFAGWDKEVGTCTGNAEFTATYSNEYINYTVVFKNYDGTVLSTKTYHYGDAIVVPADPSRPADNTYTYTFAGWDKEVGTCTGNAEYTATYTNEYIEYTVVFKNYDGTVLSTKKYHYGDAIVAPATPSRPADNTYTYTFAGWDKEVGTCAANTEFTATYSKEYIEYTVTFKNYDGTVLSTKTYHYGDKVVAPATPSRPADDTSIYIFVGWDKEVVDCNGNAEYTATYSSTSVEYTVVFKNYDGSVLSTKTYYYGDAIVAPADPTRPADNTYTYTFAGWDKEVGTCKGNAEFTATYSSEYINYTVVFKNYDGSVLSTKTYHYGDTIVAPADPTRPADNTYTYTFAGWDKEVGTCTGNAEFTATYSNEYINYTIVFKNYDGTVLSTKTYHYGDTIVAPATPSKPADNTYTYTFAGWDKEVGTCTGDAEFTATYSNVYIEYTIVFKNYDGTVISTKTYHYGDTVVIPANPTREEDNRYTYEFIGWDKEVVNCVANAEYIAQYNSIKKTILGDVDDDGFVDTVDLAALKLYLVGSSNDINFNNSDLNQDEKVDTRDLALLKLLLVNA